MWSTLPPPFTVAMNIAKARWWFWLVYDSYGMGIWRSFRAMLSAPSRISMMTDSVSSGLPK